ncbi:MAG: response regulator [Angelakisella sp.]
MLTLLLVDDEPLELETLKDYIPWDTVNVGEILTAANGREALELSRCRKVDLVITDIKMPVMDGIEFARQFSGENSAAKVIFLSGYDDFDCVHNAYRAGGVDYILKPFAKNDVLRVVREAEERMEAERGMDEAQYAFLEGLLSRVIFGGDGQAIVSLRRNPAFAKVDGVCLLNLDTNATHIQFKEALRPLNRYCYAAHNQKNTVLVLPTPNRIDNIVARLRDSLSAYGGVWCSFVCSRTKTPFDQLRAQWVLTEEYKQYFFYLPGSDCVDVDSFVRYEFGGQASTVLAQLRNTPAGPGLQKLREITEVYLAEAERQKLRPALVTEHAIDIALYLAAQYPAGVPQPGKPQLMDQVLSARNIAAVGQLLRSLLDGLENQSASPGDDKNDQLVASVLVRINRDFAANITADSLAREVFLSPNYLRSIFKEKTGTTIHDCITRRRMEKAAELLGTRKYKVKEISRMVGYDSESYFCAAFLKYYHTTPSSYKNRNLV